MRLREEQRDKERSSDEVLDRRAEKIPAAGFGLVPREQPCLNIGGEPRRLPVRVGQPRLEPLSVIFQFEFALFIWPQNTSTGFPEQAVKYK